MLFVTKFNILNNWQVDQLIDIYTGVLRCTYCQTEVEEEATMKAGSGDSHSTVAKFNEEIEPIYALLRKVEDMRLSAEILEPEPLEYKPNKYVLFLLALWLILKTN